MTNTTTGPVVAGFDGSEDASAAVDLAGWEAERRHLPLRLVHGFQAVPPYGVAGLACDPQVPIRDCRAMLQTEATRIREQHPDLTITTAVIAGSPAGVLVDESKSASLVVVGSRGLGGFIGMLAGSVSGQVAAHAHAPVIVVRPPAEKATRPPAVGTGPIVVGVDGSTGSTAAMGFAFDEAAARGTDLIAVYAWGILPRKPAATTRTGSSERRRPHWPRPWPGGRTPTPASRCDPGSSTAWFRCTPSSTSPTAPR